MGVTTYHCTCEGKKMALSLDSHLSSHSRSLSLVLPTISSSDGEDSTVGSHGSVEVNYTSLLELPKTKPTSLAQCRATCTICRKVYKYNLNSDKLKKNWSLLNDMFEL